LQDRDDGMEGTGTTGRTWAPVDVELLRGVQRRDRESLGRFFDLVFPFVYSFAYRMTGERASAEDVTQEVFLKVHRAADRIDTGRSPYPWLAAITTNTCRDEVRRVVRRAERPLDEGVSTHADTGPTPDEHLARKERAHLLQQALLSLDETQRSVILLRDYSGCSHEEIAKIVGATPAAVRKRYSRALDALRVHVKRLVR
jgi:RNA polymerase sigma-70 factor (ECF subfamily)